MSTYVPLWCKSYYSFLEGASAPDDLVARAAALKLPALALTDKDGVYGVPAAYQAARGAGIALIIGSQVTVVDAGLAAMRSDGDVMVDPSTIAGLASGSVDPFGGAPTVDTSTIVLLATDRRGYTNLCRLLTAGRLRSPKGTCLVTWDEVAAHADGLLALWGSGASLLAREDGSGAARAAGTLREAFGDRLYALVARHRQATDTRAEARLRRRAARFGLGTVATVEVLYHVKEKRPLQDVLTCVREGVTVQQAGLRLRPNDRHAILGPRAFARLFRDDPAAVTRTLEIAERCRFDLGDLRYRYPSEHLPFGMSTARWLDHLAWQGARGRFGDPVPRDMGARMDTELALIHELDYDGYFLTMYEIVRFCREQGILCQGRGSAANSITCYCLKITAVNPREVDLLFERFISRERAEPPDIDLDIEHDRREEVIQHVYAKYGRERAAMVANVVRFRPRSAIREVGKALGLPAVNLDRLAKLASHYRADDIEDETFRGAGFDPASPLIAHFRRLVDEIQEVPRHLSIHPGGFLLGHEPVHDLVPIENATMPGRTVIQWDKYAVESLGLFKVDLLGLGALNHLHRAFDLLRRHRGLEMSLARIPRDDRPTFAMLHRGDSVGTFQVESRAQMNMLPRLRPDNYYDLVIQVAIIRPGPITGGMLHPYIERRHGREKVEYPHPSLEPILRKTLGVPLFQEQVMRLAMVAADYTPGEADQLRRDMATWRSHGPMEQHRDKLVTRMVAKGIAPDFAERVFQQIKGFGEYGFPESHAASFALIAYATSWLKCHHPDVFTCALLNAQPMGFYTSGTIVEDAKRHNIPILPIDVTLSEWDCILEPVRDGGVCGSAPGDSGRRPERARRAKRGAWSGLTHTSVASPTPMAVRMGLRYVKGMRREVAERIVAMRPYRDIADLHRRAQVPIETLTSLAECGGLAGFEAERRRALWVVHGISRRDRPEQLLLALPEAAAPVLPELGWFDSVNWDWKRGGHSPRAHLLEPLREQLQARGWPTAEEVNRLRHGVRCDYVGIVICRQRPHTAKGVTFMTLEDETGFVNALAWNDIWERFRVLARTLSLMGVTGKIQTADGVAHIIIDTIWEPRLSQVPVPSPSHDFH
ncbi:MAG: error-prone DNA polymerase [bacterium]|nr:error-prone DNA polymerase [bacterium]